MFLSDLHIGSRSFLEGPWESLVEFLHGRGPRPELAKEVEHVVIAGTWSTGSGSTRTRSATSRSTTSSSSTATWRVGSRSSRTA